MDSFDTEIPMDCPQKLEFFVTLKSTPDQEKLFNCDGSEIINKVVGRTEI